MREARGPEPLQARFSAVLFDLDGTLVDTRRDLVTAVNELLSGTGLTPLAEERVVRHVGYGVRNLVARCLEEAAGASPEPAAIDAGIERFFRCYSAHLLDTSRPYPGIPDLLLRLATAGIGMAVVTNKPLEPSRRILVGLDLDRCFRIVLGGESLAARKPDPAPLLHALGVLEVPASAGLMVGDSTIDVQAARAGGISAAAVTWGFQPRASLESAAPDFLADGPDALGDWILA